MTTPNNPDAMNSILRGRGRPAPTGQANTDAPDDPIAQAKEIVAGLASELDTLKRLLTEASAANKNPFAQKEG